VALLSFDQTSVTVNVGQTANFAATISVNPSLAQKGFYEGYVNARHDGSIVARLPFGLVDSLTLSPVSHDFGEHQVGYAQRPALTVTITNNTSQNKTMDSLLTVANYVLTPGANWGTAFAPSQTRTFTIRPDNGLGAATYNPTITITGSNGASMQFRPTFRVTPMPTWSISATPDEQIFGTLAVGYTQPAARTITIRNTGNQATTLDALPSIPNWTLTPGANWTLAFAANGTRTFTIQPNAGLAAGTYSPVITITDNNGASVQVQPVFTVIAPPVITTSALPSGTVGQVYSATLAATSVMPVDWAIDDGVLPSGLSLNETTGVISGEPTADGTFTFTIRATNDAGSDTQILTIAIAGASYTVTFDYRGATGGNATASKTVTNGGTYGTLPTPTRTAYTFDGWFTAASDGVKITADSTVNLTAGQTLFAQWTGAGSLFVKKTSNPARMIYKGSVTLRAD